MLYLLLVFSFTGSSPRESQNCEEPEKVQLTVDSTSCRRHEGSNVAGHLATHLVALFVSAAGKDLFVSYEHDARIITETVRRCKSEGSMIY